MQENTRFAEPRDDAAHGGAIPSAKIKPAVLLGFALIVGAWMRFFRLGAAELAGDEAASWRAASARTLDEVIRLHQHLNPGKLAIHDLTLHLWINVFGQSEAALRGLSALFGVAIVALVFFVGYQMLLAPEWSESAPGDDSDAAPTAAYGGALTAVSLIMIRYSREARMYPMMLAMLLAQVGFMVRAWRRGGASNYGATAAFTALAIAVNFTAAIALCAEGAWLGWMWLRGGRARAMSWRAGAAILIGLVLLAPFSGGVGTLVRGIHHGALNWVSRPSLLDPIETFESASGAWAFALLAPLAVWGAIAGWRTRRDAIVFALIWMWLPPMVLLIGSYLMLPMDETRYALSSFVPFYLLAALGIASIPAPRASYAVAALAVALMALQVGIYYRRPRELHYREAVTAACEVARAGEPIGVAGWSSSIASTLYYLARLAPARRGDLAKVPVGRPLPPDFDKIRVLIMPDSMRPQDLRRFRALFPRLDAHFPGVEVRSRQSAPG